jgi:hypothetical protein
MKFRKKPDLFEDFIATYDKKANEFKQQKIFKMVDIVLLVFVIIIACMVSVKP